MRRVALLLLAAGCPGPVDPHDDSDDSDPVVGDTDTDTGDSEPAVAHTDDGDTGTGDTEPPRTCSVADPDAPCPGQAACVEGRCLVDLDPGDPAPPGAVEDWDTIASWIGSRYQLFDTRPVDWAAVSAEGHDAVAAATTAFDAGWAMMRAVATLRDGHTFVRAPAVCDADPGFAAPQGNVGACVIESDGELVVNQVAAGTGWRPGDVLLDVDGRGAEDLIADRLAQPRCGNWASTEAALRTRAVSSLLWRPAGERVAHVRRGDRRAVVRLQQGRFVACAPRLPVPGETTLIGNATTATLPGGVALVALPEMGVPTPTGFEGPPLVDALRTWASSLAPGTPIVVDLRGNGGGFPEVASTFGDWLLPTGTELWRCRDRYGDAPDQVGPERAVLAEDDPLELTGRVAVLTDGATYGFGESLPWILAQTGRGLLVGAPTGGSFGIVWTVPVGDWGAKVNALRCVRPSDDHPIDGDPPPVDLPVAITPADAAAGVDTVLEAARRALLAP